MCIRDRCNSDAQSLPISKKAAVNLSTVSDKVVLSYLKTTYDKTEKEPDVTIEGLVKDTDYSVTYSNNVNAGTATVTIVGMNDYVGTLYQYFTIEPAKMTGVSVHGYKGCLLYTSCDDSTWNNCAGWTGAGIIGRSECINAKFIAGFCAEKVRAV